MRFSNVRRTMSSAITCSYTASPMGVCTGVFINYQLYTCIFIQFIIPAVPYMYITPAHYMYNTSCPLHITPVHYMYNTSCPLHVTPAITCIIPAVHYMYTLTPVHYSMQCLTFDVLQMFQ